MHACEGDMEIFGSQFDSDTGNVDPNNGFNDEIQHAKNVGMMANMRTGVSTPLVSKGTSASILPQQAKDSLSHGQRLDLSELDDMINIPDPQQERKAFIVQSAMKNIETVWKWLNDKDVATIKIEGEVGVGKTWTVKQVLSRARLEPNLFDIVIWVDLANDVLSDEMVQIQILRQSKLVGTNSYNEEVKKDLSRGELRKEISMALADKRYMLILNDVMSLNACNLEELGVPLSKEHNKTSKVLITGRRSLTKHLITDKVLELKGLPEDEAWLLFQNISGLEIYSPHRQKLLNPWLEDCDGLPSEIVNLGESLNMLSAADFLKTTAYSDVLNLRNHAEAFLCQILPSKDARDCFYYCTLYPSNHIFSVKGLLMSWIFEGFLDGFDSFKDAREKSEDILVELIDHNVLFKYDDKHVKVNILLRQLGSFRSDLFTFKYSHPLIDSQTLERHSMMNENLQTIITEELARLKGPKAGIPLISTGNRQTDQEPKSCNLENESHVVEDDLDTGNIDPNCKLHGELQHAHTEEYSPSHEQSGAFRSPTVTDADTGSSKRQKMYVEQNCGSFGDRISSLPDNILHYIISFLPTKYAVGSSVLSTRWKYLWTSIHKFDFYDKLTFSGCKSVNYSKRKTMFTDFVDQVLQLNDVRNIHKFVLTCKGCDADHFNKWVSNIMRRKVEELLITINEIPPRMHPTDLSACLPQDICQTMDVRNARSPMQEERECRRPRFRLGIVSVSFGCKCEKYGST